MSTLSSLPSITLNENEAHLCSLLVQCADWVDANPELVDQLRLKDETTGEWIGKKRGDEPVELRIAGGWVRDKLLGRNSDDIDVSTSPDPITGLKFATLFERYLDSIGKRDLMGRLTTIEAKPEQSKHLETATAIACGLSVDWVQQRGQEVYTQGSRIPTVAFGTPLEDAERRDLTINALFYNLRTQSIEDQTGKGLADLGLIPGQRKRIRTPLEPFRTFHDDPLRVIRAVRFAARFGREFELNEDLVEAIKREEIRAALKDPKKISRERVGIELDKMLTGQDPHLAMELIDRLNLHELIFLYEPTTLHTLASTEVEPTIHPTSLSIRASSILTSLLSPPSSSSSPPPLHPLLQLRVVPLDPTIPHPTFPSLSPNEISLVYPQTIRRLYLACALLPLTEAFSTEKKRTLWVGERVVREGLKWSAADGVWARKAREAQVLISTTLSNAEKEGRQLNRAEMGLLMRHSSVDDRSHSRWNVSLFWSLVVELVSASSKEQVSKVIERYNAFVVRALEFGLETKAFDPPLLDGKAVNALIPQTKNSPAMAGILDLVVQYQLGHSEASPEEVGKWLVENDEAKNEIARLLKMFERPLKIKKKGGAAAAAHQAK